MTANSISRITITSHAAETLERALKAALSTSAEKGLPNERLWPSGTLRNLLLVGLDPSIQIRAVEVDATAFAYHNDLPLVDQVLQRLPGSSFISGGLLNCQQPVD